MGKGVRSRQVYGFGAMIAAWILTMVVLPVKHAASREFKVLRGRFLHMNM